MEAASIPRQVRRMRPSRKATAAAVAYACAVLYMLLIVAEARDGAPPLAEASGIARAQPVQGPSDLGLRAVVSRVSRSVVAVGNGNGFVAWTYRGASLLVAYGGFEVRQELAVDAPDGRSWVATVIRVDADRQLALLRVDGSVAAPLWQERRPAGVDPQEALVLVGGEGSVQLGVEAARYEAVEVGVRPGPPLAGSPVLNGSGRLVGVATPDAVVPIGRLCGAIRKC